MKLISKSALILGLLSSDVIASEYISSIENIEVTKTDLLTLSIHNLSREKIEIEIDIYGETINLSPASGIQYECSEYEFLELKIRNNEHEYFEVPCRSRVVITESFTNQYKKGE